MILVIILLFIILPIAAAKHQLRNIDIFTMHHNYRVGSFMQIKRTRLGGLCTVLLVLVVVIIIFNAIIFNTYDNVSEIKALIPIVVVN